MSNGKVTRDTHIQLPDMNHSTIGQWFNKQAKKREQDTLRRGLPQPPREAAPSKAPLPVAVPLPPSLPQVSFPVPFQYVLPANTAGTATLRGQRLQPRPPQPQPVPIRKNPATTTMLPVAIQARPEAKAQPRESRTPKRSLYEMICSKCGKQRDPVNHKQYFGNWYCNTMAESFEEWKENLKKIKQYKKKKTE